MYENIKITSILIDITKACNMECTHCYKSSFDGCDYMDIDKINNIINEIREYELKNVALTGGEPLMHPDFGEILEIVKANSEIEFELTTNGLLLTQEIIEEVEKIPNIIIQISIDGAMPATYEAQRGKGSFEDFKKGFDLLASSSVSKRARTAVSKLNYREIDQIYKMCADNNFTPSFIFVANFGNAEKNWENLKLNNIQKMSILNKITNLNKKYNLNASVSTPASSCSFSHYKERESVLIESNGSVIYCQWLFKWSIGNIFDTKIADIFRGEKLNELYGISNKRYDDLNNNPMCVNCDIRSQCDLGCPGMALENGNIYGLDGECELRKTIASITSIKEGTT